VLLFFCLNVDLMDFSFLTIVPLHIKNMNILRIGNFKIWMSEDAHVLKAGCMLYP